MNGDIKPPTPPGMNKDPEPGAAQSGPTETETETMGDDEYLEPPKSVDQTPAPQTDTSTPPAKPEKSGSKAGLWIAIALIFGLLAGGAAGYFFSESQNKVNSETQAQIDDLNKQLQDAQASVTQSNIDEKDKQIEELQTENATLQNQVSDLEKQVQELQDQINNGSGSDTNSDNTTQ